MTPKKSAASHVRGKQESSSNPCPLGDDIVLGEYDVVCGRGKLARSHSGNRHLRLIVERHREMYQRERSREEKARISTGIVEGIRSMGGRFLKLDEDTNKWNEAGDAFAKDKVSHALRSARDFAPRNARGRRQNVDTRSTGEQSRNYTALRENQQRIFRSLLHESTRSADESSAQGDDSRN